MTDLNKQVAKFSLEIDLAQKLCVEGNPFSLLLCNNNVGLFVYKVITVTLVIVSFPKHYCCKLLNEIIVSFYTYIRLQYAADMLHVWK